MTSVKEISTEWLNDDAIRKAADSDENYQRPNWKYKTTQSSPVSIP
jgi:hypothetical protein